MPVVFFFFVWTSETKAASKFKAYQMPCAIELFNQLGAAHVYFNTVFNQGLQCPEGKTDKHPSPLHFGCTNLSPLHSACLEPRPHFNDSWTESFTLKTHMLLIFGQGRGLVILGHF